LHSFGQWRFDAETGDLFDGETSTRLEPQVAKLLEYFLVNQNKLTSRDELISSVWENRSVSDDAINRCISILRSHLTPDDKNAFIETVIRRGFVSHFPDAHGAPHESGTPDDLVQTAHPRKQRVKLLLTVLAGAAVVLLFQLGGNHQEPAVKVPDTLNDRPPVVAVLPFATLGEADDSEFFASGVHDDLLTQMAQLQSLRVISRTSVLEYQGAEQNIRVIGKELGADAVLEGSIQSFGDKIRINVQLIDALTDEHLWAETYDRQMSTENIFDVQAEIASSIATALKTALTDQDATQLNVLPTENMAAYRAYHRSMEIRDTLGVDDPAYLAALEEAVNLDPTFVRAWAELSGLLSFNNFGRHDTDSIQRVESILAHIQTLAPQSAELLIAQSYYSYYILKNYKEAYELIKLAQNMRPSDERVLELKSHIERRLGDFDARIESLRLARQLDPRNPHWTTTLILNLIVVHQYKLAQQDARHSSIQTIRLAEFQSMLNLQNGWDPNGWVESLKQLEIEYGTGVRRLELWEALFAARDFEAADDLLLTMQDQGQLRNFWEPFLDSNSQLSRLITLHFLDDSDRLHQLLTLARAQIDEQLNSDGEFEFGQQNLILAYMTAIEGNTEETKRIIRNWDRQTISDIAGYTVLRVHTCRALGMAAANKEAVECIRKGLIEPSYMMPFMEPNLPYYDSIRESPEFIGLLVETGNIQTNTDSSGGLKY
jgi:TolB-like protein/DNA-binding winged helix-turn-helix (wHTH) protein/tetratricopeptide (TPR) repeat protein